MIEVFTLSPSSRLAIVHSPRLSEIASEDDLLQLNTWSAHAHKWTRIVHVSKLPVFIDLFRFKDIY
jgi:hypothetical protein